MRASARAGRTAARTGGRGVRGVEGRFGAAAVSVPDDNDVRDFDRRDGLNEHGERIVVLKGTLAAMRDVWGRNQITGKLANEADRNMAKENSLGNVAVDEYVARH